MKSINIPSNPKSVTFQEGSNTQVFNAHEPTILLSNPGDQRFQQPAVDWHSNNNMSFLDNHRYTAPPPSQFTTDGHSIDRAQDTERNVAPETGFQPPKIRHDVELTLSGVDKSVSPEMIMSYANKKEISIKFSLLNGTRQITVGMQHAEKSLSDSVWPAGVKVTQYRSKKNSPMGNTSASWNTIKQTNHYGTLYVPEVGRYSLSS